MGLADWSSGKVRLVMLAAAAPIMLAMVVSKYHEETVRREDPSADCIHADQAAQQLAFILPAAGRKGLPWHAAEEALATDAVAAIRDEVAAIEDWSLRGSVTRLADHAEKLRASYPCELQATLTALHELQDACPNVASGPPPSDISPIPPAMP